MPHLALSDSSHAALLDAAVDRHGFAVVPVGYGGCTVPGCCGPAASHPWTYTVGLARRGLPELVLLGLDPLAAHFALGWVATEALAGRPVAPDRAVELRGTAIKVVAVPDEWVLTDPERMAAWFAARTRHGGPSGLPAVHQVVWADREGRFPDDPSCRPAVSEEQPVLRDDPFSLPHRAPRAVRRAAARGTRVA